MISIVVFVVIIIIKLLFLLLLLFGCSRRVMLLIMCCGVSAVFIKIGNTDIRTHCLNGHFSVVLGLAGCPLIIVDVEASILHAVPLTQPTASKQPVCCLLIETNVLLLSQTANSGPKS